MILLLASELYACHARHSTPGGVKSELGSSPKDNISQSKVLHAQTVNMSDYLPDAE